MNVLRPFVGLAIAATLCGCNSTETDWNEASTANTVSSYQQFLSNHPSGPHAADSTDRIRTLQDEAAWVQAKQANSGEAYRAYLRDQPTGMHMKEAQDAATAVDRAADWKSAQSTVTVASMQDFLKKYPQGAEADAARTQLSALNGYKVQMATAKTKKQAEKEREQLNARYGSILHDVSVVPGDSGKTYGLQSGPMSESQADSACSELKKAHHNCEVLKNDASHG